MRLTTSRRLRRLAVSSLATCALAVAASPPPASAASPSQAAAWLRKGRHPLPDQRPSALRTAWSPLGLDTPPQHGRPPPLAGHGRQALLRPRLPERGALQRPHRPHRLDERPRRLERRREPRLGQRHTGRAPPRSSPPGCGSADHRANILGARFRVIGIGIAGGTPPGAGAGATYATDFGS